MSRALSLLALLPLAACVHVYVEEDVVTLDGPVEAVLVDVDSGDVTIVTGDDIRIERRVETTAGRAVTLVAELIDGTLHIEGHCDELFGFCSVDQRIVVPAAVAAAVTLGSGDLSVSGLEGGLLAESGSGDVVVDGVPSVVVGTGSGDVEVTGATDLDVDAGSGDIVFSTAAALVGVRATAGSGDIDLTVPAGNYALDLDTGSGDVTLQQVGDDAAAAPIFAHTGSGDVTVRGR